MLELRTCADISSGDLFRSCYRGCSHGTLRFQVHSSWIQSYPCSSMFSVEIAANKQWDFSHPAPKQTLHLAGFRSISIHHVTTYISAHYQSGMYLTVSIKASFNIRSPTPKVIMLKIPLRKCYWNWDTSMDWFYGLAISSPPTKSFFNCWNVFLWSGAGVSETTKPWIKHWG